MIAVVAFLLAVVCYLGAGVTYARIHFRREQRLLAGEAGFITLLWPMILMFDVADWFVRRGRERA